MGKMYKDKTDVATSELLTSDSKDSSIRETAADF